MTDDNFELPPPELSREDLLIVDNPRSSEDTTALVIGAASGIGQARTKEMTPAEVANLFTFGFSRHGSHLNGGDMLWDGGYTNTYQ